MGARAGLIEISVSFSFSTVYLADVYEVDPYFGRQNQQEHLQFALANLRVINRR